MNAVELEQLRDRLRSEFGELGAQQIEHDARLLQRESLVSFEGAANMIAAWMRLWSFRVEASRRPIRGHGVQGRWNR